MSRSGKSRLATYIGGRMSRVLVYDPKDDSEAMIPNASVAATADDAIRALRTGASRIVFRPDRAAMANIADEFDRILDEHWQLVLRGLPFCIVVHELGDLATGDRIPAVLSETIRKGQGKGVMTVFVTQRPTDIPRGSVSEAKHTFTLYLRDDRDRKAAAVFAGDLIVAQPLERDFSFYYTDPNGVVRHYPKLGGR